MHAHVPRVISAEPSHACMQGNLILTDSSYEILTLLRSYRDDDKGYAIMAKHPYPIRTVRNRVPVTAEALSEALAKPGPKPSLKGEPVAESRHRLFGGQMCFGALQL